MYTITLSKAKAAGACESAYKAALKAVKDKEKPLTIEDLEAIEGLTLGDLYWAVRLTNATPLEVRRLKADNAALVLDIFEEQYPKDRRPRKAIEVARDANSTAEELINTATATATATAATAAYDAAYAAATTYNTSAVAAAAAAVYAVYSAAAATTVAVAITYDAAHFAAYIADRRIASKQRRLLRGFFHGDYKRKETLL